MAVAGQPHHLPVRTVDGQRLCPGEAALGVAADRLQRLIRWQGRLGEQDLRRRHQIRVGQRRTDRGESETRDHDRGEYNA